MDSPYTFHSFTEADLSPLAELLHRYRAVVPIRPQTDGHVYLSPAFESGQYVLCAESDDRRLVAYAAFYPQGEMAWTHILVEIGLPKANMLQDRLFDWLIDLARKPGIIRLAFQYYPAERGFIDFIQNKGAKYAHSIYAMQRSLGLPIPIIPPPEGFEIRQLRMRSEKEQIEYIEAHNECFPETPLALSEWQYLVYSPWWTQGVCMMAQTGGTIAGSIAVYWEPGSRTGYTEYVFTRPAFRGHGLARALLAESLRYLKSHGLDQALLEVRAENENALKIYRELGYRLVSESQVWEYILRNSG